MDLRSRSVSGGRHCPRGVTQRARPLRQIDPLVGRFECRGIAYASPMGPEHATAGTVDAKWVLDGQWAAFTYAETKTPANPQPFAVSGYFGWDAQSRKYVVTGIDNGGGHGTSESTGWSGDAITFIGPYQIAGMTMNGRDTFTRSGNELTHAFEVEENGTWRKMSQETCTKK